MAMACPSTPRSCRVCGADVVRSPKSREVFAPDPVPIADCKLVGYQYFGSARAHCLLSSDSSTYAPGGTMRPCRGQSGMSRKQSRSTKLTPPQKRLAARARAKTPASTKALSTSESVRRVAPSKTSAKGPPPQKQATRARAKTPTRTKALSTSESIRRVAPSKSSAKSVRRSASLRHGTTLEAVTIMNPLAKIVIETQIAIIQSMVRCSPIGILLWLCRAR